MLGLSILGPKALTYVFGSKEGFEEYRVQRENGTPQELAFKRALAKTGYSIIEEKVDGYIFEFSDELGLSAKIKDNYNQKLQVSHCKTLMVII